MELQVSSPLDFNFHSTSSSPFVSPPRFFLSVPSSPTRPHSPSTSSSESVIQQPPHHDHLDNNLDFQFDFSGQLHHTHSVSADQLFHAGKIRPLKPPPAPKLVRRRDSDFDSDSDTVSAFKFNNQFSSSSTLEEESRKEDEEEGKKQLQMRGRSGRASSMSFFPASASSSRRGSRSLSPLRAPSYSDADDEDFSSSTSNNNNNPIPKRSSSSSFLSSISFTKKGYRKWRLKDFLLFRSASEGRAAGAGKDPLRKYAVLSKKAAEEELTMRNSGSFRSTESGGSGSRRRGGPVSAHEMHYTLNRAASEEMKKKTVLPYKQLGPLGCLGFTHDITKGIQSLTR